MVSTASTVTLFWTPDTSRLLQWPVITTVSLAQAKQLCRVDELADDRKSTIWGSLEVEPERPSRDCRSSSVREILDAGVLADALPVTATVSMSYNLTCWIPQERHGRLGRMLVALGGVPMGAVVTTGGDSSGLVVGLADPDPGDVDVAGTAVVLEVCRRGWLHLQLPALWL